MRYLASTPLVPLLVCALALAIGCDVESDPTETLRQQGWKTTVEEVDGLPIGERQVELESETDDLDREAALQRLRRRKRIVKEGLTAAPERAELYRRQAMVETFLLERSRDGVEGKEIPDDQIDAVRTELAQSMRKPHGFVATIVRVRAESDQTDRGVLDVARELASELGDDPSDDAVAALAERDIPGFEVFVSYGVPFQAADEPQRRPGWVQVAPIGAGEVQSLTEGDRVTTAYTLNPDNAEFMVKIMEIPEEAADPERVSELIDQRVDDVRRSAFTQKLVKRLVEEGSWTMYPEIMDNEMESK